MVDPSRISVLGIKFGSVLANLASVAGFAFYIADRTSSLPTVSGARALNVVLHLAVLSAIAYGVFWAIVELLFDWKYGAGGNQTVPFGWSAVVLSLCMTLPLAFVPLLYQKLSGVPLLLPSHWRAIFVVILLAAGGHLLIYGTESKVANGLRQRIIPARKHIPFASALLMEVVYSITYFGFIVLPYRMIVKPTEPFRELILGRTLLPCLVFFFGMTLFIGLKFPGSLRDPTWIQVRGIIGGLLMMFCLCGGMFL
jgi:hypothetical protein